MSSALWSPPQEYMKINKLPKGIPIILCMFLCVSTSCKNMQYKKMVLSTCCSKLCSYLMIVVLVVNLWNKVCLTTNSAHLHRENVCLRQRPQPDVKQSILPSRELWGAHVSPPCQTMLPLASPPAKTIQSLLQDAAGAIWKGDKLWFFFLWGD